MKQAFWCKFSRIEVDARLSANIDVCVGADNAEKETTLFWGVSSQRHPKVRLLDFLDVPLSLSLSCRSLFTF